MTPSLGPKRLRIKRNTKSIAIEARRCNVASSDAPAARQNHPTAPVVPAEEVNVSKDLIFPGSDQEPAKTDAIGATRTQVFAQATYVPPKYPGILNSPIFLVSSDISIH
jgi:hypothetical protein